MSSAALAPSFAEALAPVSVETFLADYWCREMLRVPGRPGKFAALMPWSELERILEQHHHQPPELDLYQNGKLLPAERYLTEQRSNSVVNSAGLMNALAGGASLVLKSVEDLTSGARAYTESMEQTLQLNCWTHLFAAWRKQNAFDLHYDRWSVFVLQVAGRKRWKVYRPTLPYPVKEDRTMSAPLPTEPPAWEGVLEDGDLLYMPRGWWHVAVPEDGLSLHISFSLDPVNGVDLLRWLADELAQHEEVRMDLPNWASPEVQQRHRERLRELVARAFDGPHLFQDCRAAQETKIAPRARVRLGPELGGGLTLTADSRVRLTTARRLAFSRRDQERGPTTTFFAGERLMKCGRELVPALAQLGPEPVTVRALCEQLPQPEAAPRLKLFLGVLLTSGLLALEPGT